MRQNLPTGVVRHPLRALLGILLCTYRPAHGHSEYRSLIPNGFNVPGQEGVGHHQIHGGGALNPFGSDFIIAGFRWTLELCRKDSDGDGESNGLELGDPCCEWKEGDTSTRRPYQISSPGILNQPTHCCKDVVALSGTVMPNCTELVQTPMLDVSGAADVQDFVDGDANSHFWDFYFTDVGETTTNRDGTLKEQEKFSLWRGGSGLIHGGQNVASVVLFLELGLMSHFYRGIHVKKVWGEALQRRPLRVVYQGAVFIIAVLYTEVISGLLHIVLDNPLFNEWPGIGPAAISFQHHHHDPAGVTRGSYFNFLREHHIVVALGAGTAFMFPRTAKGAETMYTFFFYIVPLTSLMMASHRWSHTPPPRLPYGVASLQSWGFLMTQRHHSLHHVGYHINFAIFTGWSNPMLNYITRHWLKPTAEAWVWILLGWVCLPLCACWSQLLWYGRKHTQSHLNLSFLPYNATTGTSEPEALNSDKAC